MPFSRDQIEHVVRPWKLFLSDVFDKRHTTDLGRMYSAVSNRESNPNARRDTNITRVRRIISLSNNSRPEANTIWTFAKAARATGVKWFAGPLALLAAGHMTEFAKVMEVAGLPKSGISTQRLEDLLLDAPGACRWFGPQPAENREAQRRRVDRCRAGDLLQERRTWICKPKEEYAFEQAWLDRDRQKKDNVVLAVSVVKEHLELKRGKQHEIVVTLLANWL